MKQKKCSVHRTPTIEFSEMDFAKHCELSGKRQLEKVGKNSSNLPWFLFDIRMNITITKIELCISP